MLEDAGNALNPMPLIGAVFGSGYPVCQEVELPVGDQAGNIFSKENQSWIGNAASARLTKRDGRYFQKAWIQALDPKTKIVSSGKASTLKNLPSATRFSSCSIAMRV